ncbi:MAG: radical SAM protein [Thermoplasmatota archaeon]
MDVKLTYGPVPSRRLGRSIGVNNIPPKVCTYSCVYCQLGKTINMQVKREEFFSLERISKSIKWKIDNAVKRNEDIDFITFVPDGEPSLDINIEDKIESVKKMGYRVAVISNASLIWDEGVRAELTKADWVSLKLDAVTPGIWKRINRPHRSLDLDQILEGIHDFSKTFKGRLNTETMMVKGLNDTTDEIKKIADEISDINADKSYISIPTRPPAEDWVTPPNEEKITKAYQIFKNRDIDAEYLIGYEGDSFASFGDIKEDLLSITSVHPMRERQVKRLLSKNGEDWKRVQELIEDDKLIETHYKGEKFYMRKLF